MKRQKQNPSRIEPTTSRLEDWYPNHCANEATSTGVSDDILQHFYLRVQVRLSRETKIRTISGKLDLYTAVLQVKIPAVRYSRAASFPTPSARQVSWVRPSGDIRLPHGPAAARGGLHEHAGGHIAARDDVHIVCLDCQTAAPHPASPHAPHRP